MSRYLVVPGWAGSGPLHWQSHWERELPDASRIEMLDWLEPRRVAWTNALDRAVRSTGEPPTLIAHSLGCVAIAHWATTTDLAIRSALLVAPADVERNGRPSCLADFSPVPRTRLRFPSRIVASDDDPYAALPRVRELAADWGSELTVLPGAKHINAESGHERWAEGIALLRALERQPAVPMPWPPGPDLEEPWICRGTD